MLSFTLPSLLPHALPVILWSPCGSTARGYASRPYFSVPHPALLPAYKRLGCPYPFSGSHSRRLIYRRKRPERRFLVVCTFNAQYPLLALMHYGTNSRYPSRSRPYHVFLFPLNPSLLCYLSPFIPLPRLITVSPCFLDSVLIASPFDHSIPSAA